jgi:UDP-N-acetylmuramate--alanine ligase
MLRRRLRVSWSRLRTRADGSERERGHDEQRRREGAPGGGTGRLVMHDGGVSPRDPYPDQAGSSPAGHWADRRLHLVGMGGAGMSAYALAAHGLGAEVTGSDRAWSPYAERLLEQTGIRTIVGHKPENVPAGDDVEVVHSTAIAQDNPEREAARARGLPDRPRADLLGEIAATRRVIAVAGAHGKTTTSAMIAVALRAAGMDPGWIIGGEVPDLGSNAGWTEGEWLVVEADESDRSFLALRPQIAVVTNVELDHHHTYGSRAELDDAFRAFLAGSRRAVVWDRPELLALAEGIEVFPFERDEDLRLRVPGEHNRRNAAAALRACELAGADARRCREALSAFTGARRRFEELGTTATGARVVDDYAHHPTEVAATISAARSQDPGRLVAVFQPHLFSRTRELAGDFTAALAAADRSLVLPVYPARERAEDFPGVDSTLIAAGGHPASFEEAAGLLRAELRAGDLCLVMGAGDVDTLGRMLVEGGESPR